MVGVIFAGFIWGVVAIYFGMTRDYLPRYPREFVSLVAAVAISHSVMLALDGIHMLEVTYPDIVAIVGTYLVARELDVSIRPVLKN